MVKIFSELDFWRRGICAADGKASAYKYGLIFTRKTNIEVQTLVATRRNQRIERICVQEFDLHAILVGVLGQRNELEAGSFFYAI